MRKRLEAKWRMIPLTVKVSTSYAICSILQKCLSFITLPLFTRLLTTEQYGQYTIYQSWSGILTIFLTLNLAYGSFSTAMTKYEKDRDTYISSIEGLCLLLVSIFLILYLPTRFLWNGLFQLPTPLIFLMTVEILATAGIQFWSGKKRFEFKYKSVIVVTLTQSILSPLLAFVLVQHTVEKGYARICGYSLVIVVIGGILFLNNLHRGRKVFVKKYWKYALGFNIPLIAYYLSQTIFNQSDRIMISHYCGEGDAALYGVAHNLAMILTFILNAINNSYVPWFYGKIKNGKEEENQTISCGIAIIMAVLILGIIWYAPEIITIMAGKQYLEAVGVVAPVAMSLLLLFYAQLFINVEFYYEEKRSLVLASIGSALVNIVLNALLIPRFSFVSAGYATLCSYLLFVICNYFAMKRTVKKYGKKNEAYQIKKLILIFLLFAICSIFGVLLYQMFWIRLAITIIVFMIIVCYRKKWMYIIQSVKR